MDPYLGEIKLVPFNFAPIGWAFCDGALLSITQNTALFALLGTTYGGNGQTTFALPDFRGRVALSVGQGPGLSPQSQGQTSGKEEIELIVSEMPAHGHILTVGAALGTDTTPVGKHLAKSPLALGFAYGAGSSASMPGAVRPTGSGTAHENRQPYLVLNYIIATQGIFPPRERGR